MWRLRLSLQPVRWIISSRTLSTARSRINPRSGPRNTLRRPPRISPERRKIPPESAQSPHQTDPLDTTEAQGSVKGDYDPAQNSLLAPVHIPQDPNGVLKEGHPAAGILANSGLVVQRQLELMNVMIGFEQANKYVIMDAHGNHIGYMAEQERGTSNMVARQLLRTHRSFTTHVFDRHQNEVLRFHRPFSWINSRIRVYDPLEVASNVRHGTSPGSLVSVSGESDAKISPFRIDEMRVIGEAQQVWSPLRRKYDLFLYHHPPNAPTDMNRNIVPLSKSDFSAGQQAQLEQASPQGEGVGEFFQFAYVDEPFLSWDFSLRGPGSQLIASVNRNFAGFARELFTDTGVYALRMDSASLGRDGMATVAQDLQITGMTLDQRAVMLATAVTIDFDYFSRHSHGFMPIWFWDWE